MAYAKEHKGLWYLYGSRNEYIGALGKTTREEADRIAREYARRYEAPLPPGKFDVIYADPPWRFETWSERGKGRSAEQHYETMDLKSICRLDIQSRSAKDAVLFLWGISPMVPQALEVMEAWGFEYKTSLVWVKDKIGLGYYVRSRHEWLVVGGRGKSKVPATMDRWESVIFASRREHSEKPRTVYDMIEAAYPESKWLELFARVRREGWTSWGAGL